MEHTTDKRVLITGASRGIGKAIALQLAREGMRVAINYVQASEQAELVRREAEALGAEALALQADVSDRAAVDRLVDQITSAWGGVDILVNNAAIAIRRQIADTTEADFEQTIGVNLKSSFLVTQAVLPHMLKNRWGRIIFISSTAAQTGGNVGLHYAASKAGQLGMMHFYAARLSRQGITVNALAPGLIETDMLQGLENPEAAKPPVGRFGEPEEVARAVSLLIANGYITNQTINLNGGLYPS